MSCLTQFRNVLFTQWYGCNAYCTQWNQTRGHFDSCCLMPVVTAKVQKSNGCVRGVRLMVCFNILFDTCCTLSPVVYYVCGHTDCGHTHSLYLSCTHNNRMVRHKLYPFLAHVEFDIDSVRLCCGGVCDEEEHLHNKCWCSLCESVCVFGCVSLWSWEPRWKRKLSCQ